MLFGANSAICDCATIFTIWIVCSPVCLANVYSPLNIHLCLTLGGNTLVFHTGSKGLCSYSPFIHIHCCLWGEHGNIVFLTVCALVSLTFVKERSKIFFVEERSKKKVFSSVLSLLHLKLVKLCY